MPEYFKSVRAINLAPDNSRGGIDIFFERVDNPPPDDKNVEALRSDYEETMFVLKDMDLPDPDFGTLFNALLAGAQVGLEGPRQSLDAGLNQLKNVRRSLVKLARKERDNYLIRLSFVGGAVAAIALIVTWIFYAEVPKYLTDPALRTAFTENFQPWLLPGSLLHPGVVLGVVFTGFLLNRTFTFEKIRNFDQYYFPPGLRFFYVSVVSYILFAALWFKVIMLGIGGFLLNDVKTAPEAGLLIGMVCGISEAVVVDLLVSRFKPVERGGGQQ